MLFSVNSASNFLYFKDNVEEQVNYLNHATSWLTFFKVNL